MSTDRPNDAAIELAAVPTITSAATTLRVSSSMIMKISVSADTTAIMRSIFGAVVHVLEGRGGTAQIHLGVRQGGLFQPFLRGGSLRVDTRDAFRGHRIALVGDEEARRLAVG